MYVCVCICVYTHTHTHGQDELSRVSPVTPGTAVINNNYLLIPAPDTPTSAAVWKPVTHPP